MFLLVQKVSIPNIDKGGPKDPQPSGLTMVSWETTRSKFHLVKLIVELTRVAHYNDIAMLLTKQPSSQKTYANTLLRRSVLSYIYHAYKYMLDCSFVVSLFFYNFKIFSHCYACNLSVHVSLHIPLHHTTMVQYPFKIVHHRRESRVLRVPP